MSSEVNLNLLQEVPQSARRKKKKESGYNFDAWTLAFLQNKARQQDKRLQAIEEMVAAIYLAVDEIRSSLAEGKKPSASPLSVSRNERMAQTKTESEKPGLWARFFNPRSLRRRPPF